MKRTVFPKHAAILNQLDVYLRCIGWLGLDAFRVFWQRSTMVVMLNALGIGAAAGFLGGVFLFIRQLDKGGDIRFAGLRLSFSGDAPTVLAIMVAFAALGAASAFCIYFAEWQISRVALEYQKRCANRVFRIISDPACEGWQVLANQTPDKFILSMLGIKIRYASITVRQLLEGILPFGMLGLALCALVYLDPFLTASLLPLMAIYLVPLYYVNRGVTLQQRSFQETTPRARDTLRKAIVFAVHTEGRQAEKIESGRDALNTEDYHLSTRLFFQRKLANDRMQVVNTTFFAVCLLGLLFVHIVRTQDTARDWSAFLLYLVALRFAVSGLRQVSSMFVMLSRFYPECSDYVRFIVGAEKIRSARTPEESGSHPLPAELVFRCWNPLIEGSEDHLGARKGQIVWLIQPDRPKYGNLKAVAVWLQENVEPSVDMISGSVFFARSPVRSPPGGQTPGVKGNSPDAAGPGHEPASWLKPYRIAFVDAACFSRLPGETQARFITDHADAYTFLVTDKTRSLLTRSFADLQPKLAGVIVMADADVVGCGSAEWASARQGEIDRILGAAPPEREVESSANW